MIIDSDNVHVAKKPPPEKELLIRFAVLAHELRDCSLPLIQLLYESLSKFVKILVHCIFYENR